jgi:hypothetical protein
MTYAQELVFERADFAIEEPAPFLAPPDAGTTEMGRLFYVDDAVVLATAPLLEHGEVIRAGDQLTAASQQRQRARAAGIAQSLLDLAFNVPGVRSVEWLDEDDVLHIDAAEDADAVDVLLAVGRALRAAIGDEADCIRLHVA